MSAQPDGTLTCDGGEWGVGCDETATDGHWRPAQSTYERLFLSGLMRDDGWTFQPESGRSYCRLHSSSPYATRDHHLYIYGQSSADGWACRRPGCDWQAPLGNADRASAQAIHDEYVAARGRSAQ